MALEDVLGKIPGLAGYLGRQEFDQNQLFKQLQQTSGAVTLANALRDRQQAEQFQQEVAALGPGASPEDYGKVGLKYGKPADLIKGADEYQKIVDARKTREALQQGLERIMGGSRAPTAAPSPIAPDIQETQQAADQGMPAPQPQTHAAAPTGVRDVSARLDQLKQLSMLYAGNPAAVTAINREIDKLEAPSRDQPSVHVKQDITSPTGWSYADVKTDKIMSKGAPAPVGNLNIAGGRESVYIQRMMMGANQASKDLANVVQLPLTASTGFFGGRKQGPGLFDAGREVLANKATGQEAQAYNAMATGFQRSLAQIESAGLMPSGSLTHQMDAVLFKEGDTNLTKLHKLAQTRQIVEAGMEVIEANPRVTPQEKEKVASVLQSIRKSVPFTHSDLIKLQVLHETNPNATLKDVLETKPVGWSIRPK